MPCAIPAAATALIPPGAAGLSASPEEEPVIGEIWGTSRRSVPWDRPRLLSYEFRMGPKRGFPGPERAPGLLHGAILTCIPTSFCSLIATSIHCRPLERAFTRFSRYSLRMAPQRPLRHTACGSASISIHVLGFNHRPAARKDYPSGRACIQTGTACVALHGSRRGGEGCHGHRGCQGSSLRIAAR